MEHSDHLNDIPNKPSMDYLPTRKVKHGQHEEGEMQANIPIPWSICWGNPSHWLEIDVWSGPVAFHGANISKSLRKSILPWPWPLMLVGWVDLFWGS